MAAETFKITGGSLLAGDDPDGVDAADAAVLQLYTRGFPGASNTSGVITLDNTDLAGTDALSKFAELVRFCEASGCRLEYVESA